jgi:type VI secretion system secreted protein Hcp
MALGTMAVEGGKGDVFLKVESARQGPIKGESHDEKHKDEIDVLSWSWGMRSQTTIAGGTAGKATLNELAINKRIDCASTALMSAMRNNDVIKKAVLTLRKAGGTQHEYCKVTIENGRITAIDIRSDASGSADFTESLNFAFQKIRFDYTPQGGDGQPRGGMSFETEIA